MKKIQEAQTMNDIENGMLFYTEEEPEEFCKCTYCGDTIYYGDEYYQIGYDCVCEDCVSSMKREAM